MSGKESAGLRVNGVRLEYQHISVADSDRPTLVFLHEGLGSVSMWKDYPEKVCRETACNGLLYSRQSYGNSDPLSEPRTPDYLQHEATVVLPAILAELELGNPVLIGHSDGASIALIYAAIANAPAVRGMVLMAPHVFVEELSIEGIRKARQAFEQGALRNGLANYHSDIDNAFWRWNDIWLAEEFRGWNIEHLLDRVTCPVLLVQGHDDEYGSESQLRSIESRCPGEIHTLLLENCRHSPHRDQESACLKATGNFIRTLAE